MTTPDFTVPMYGIIPALEWSIGQDEDGNVTGFIGLPHPGGPDDDPTQRGAVLTWGDPPLTGWTDEDLANAIIAACRFALKEYIARDLLNGMHGAIIEARDRLGGYRIEDDPQRSRHLEMEMLDEDKPDEG